MRLNEIQMSNGSYFRYVGAALERLLPVKTRISTGHIDVDGDRVFWHYGGESYGKSFTGALHSLKDKMFLKFNYGAGGFDKYEYEYPRPDDPVELAQIIVADLNKCIRILTYNERKRR